ncbi:permease prefix domain 1-containing protein [Gulosibacter sp. GYB002]|uniref:permease prefix domain 1-containing protein n=1 Tax=Gulosibacter sp. GYB002 TaxID=2994391 RepID=UPI002F96B151
MEAITTYLNHMFQGLPATPELQRARAELGQMAEDRYHELIAEGVSENEAVGRVISQFGNLEELADELGIRAELDRVHEDGLRLDEQQAGRFVSVRQRAAHLIGGGVLVALLGVAALVLLTPDETTETYLFSPEHANVFTAVGFGIMFLCFAIAVGMFVFAGVSLSRFEAAERGVDVPLSARQDYGRMRETETGRFALQLAIGIGVILLGLAAVPIVDILTGENEAAAHITVTVLLVLVGVGVYLLVLAGMRRTTLGMLAQEGEYDPARREREQKSNRLLELIAGPYWMLIVVIYMAWSFIGNSWGTSWIVWPIGGVLFGLIAVTTQSIQAARERDEGKC